MTRYFYLRSTSIFYRKFYRNLLSTNADNERFCIVLLTSQVAMVQSLQPMGRAFESTCVLVFFSYFFTFIRFNCCLLGMQLEYVVHIGTFYFKMI